VGGQALRTVQRLHVPWPLNHPSIPAARNSPDSPSDSTESADRPCTLQIRHQGWCQGIVRSVAAAGMAAHVTMANGPSGHGLDNTDGKGNCDGQCLPVGCPHGPISHLRSQVVPCLTSYKTELLPERNGNAPREGHLIKHWPGPCMAPSNLFAVVCGGGGGVRLGDPAGCSHLANGDDCCYFVNVGSAFRSATLGSHGSVGGRGGPCVLTANTAPMCRPSGQHRANM
jgi:hypothetical protein